MILEVDKIQHLVYKHAITTIYPDRPLERHLPVPSSSPAEAAAPVVKSNSTSTPSAKTNSAATPTDLEKFKVAMESK